MRLILASTSPRRKEILSLLKIKFEVMNPGLEEECDPRRTASDETVHWSLEKARVIASRYPKALVIASDTLIDFKGRMVGKPDDSGEALKILRMLAGQEHEVVTAVGAVMPGGSERTALEKVRVQMRRVPDEVLARYASTQEPLDKAGAYSLQGEGRCLIENLKGDYLAAVGLPLRAVLKILREAKIVVPVDVEHIYKERNFLNWKTYDVRAL